MNREDEKLKSSKRRHRDEVAVKRQAKIAKSKGNPIKDPHRLHKKHAMNCGNPGCYLCGNPRKLFKELTQQEKRLFQDVDTPKDRHSNGVKNDQEDLL